MTLGTAAPWASFTRPLMLPVVIWACAGQAAKISARATALVSVAIKTPAKRRCGWVTNALSGQCSKCFVRRKWTLMRSRSRFIGQKRTEVHSGGEAILFRRAGCSGALSGGGSRHALANRRPVADADGGGVALAGRPDGFCADGAGAARGVDDCVSRGWRPGRRQRAAAGVLPRYVGGARRALLIVRLGVMLQQELL